MKKNVFDFSGYKKYLHALISEQPHNGRGYKSVLAAHANCQLAYLTRVLQDDANFSLEQAAGISTFLGHSEEENHYFLLLVQLERSGTKQVGDYFLRQLEDIKASRLNLAKRFKLKSNLSSEDHAIYYGNWFYVAIHVLVSIPQFQVKDAIAKHFNLPMEVVVKALEFLTEKGLVLQEGNRFKAGVTRLHLGSDSPMIAKHHCNWRVQAIGALDHLHELRQENMRYTSVVTLSKSDAAKIKHVLAETIDTFNGIIKDSKDEEMRSLCIDFFKV